MDGPFFDLDIQSSQSSGRNSIKELVEMVERLEWNGIAISDYVLNSEDLKRINDEISSLNPKIEVYLGAKIKADNVKDLEERVKLVRDNVHVVIVHGGDLEINRRACEMPEVDILAHPEFERKDSGLDYVMARNAAENRVAIELNFNEILNTSKRIRSFLLSKWRRNVLLCEKFGAPIICSSGSQSIYDLRGPKALIFLLQTIGLNTERAYNSISKVPEMIIQRAQETMDKRFISPGLKRVDTTEKD